MSSLASLRVHSRVFLGLSSAGAGGVASGTTPGISWFCFSLALAASALVPLQVFPGFLLLLLAPAARHWWSRYRPHSRYLLALFLFWRRLRRRWRHSRYFLALFLFWRWWRRLWRLRLWYHTRYLPPGPLAGGGVPAGGSTPGISSPSPLSIELGSVPGPPGETVLQPDTAIKEMRQSTASIKTAAGRLDHSRDCSGALRWIAGVKLCAGDLLSLFDATAATTGSLHQVPRLPATPDLLGWALKLDWIDAFGRRSANSQLRYSAALVRSSQICARSPSPRNSPNPVT